MEPSRPAAFVATGFTILVAFLLVSRLPVYSGKSIKIPGDRVLPVILAVVLYILLLMTYPWYTLTASVAGYLIFLPFSRARLFQARQARGREGAAFGYQVKRRSEPLSSLRSLLRPRMRKAGSQAATPSPSLSIASFLVET